MSKRETPTRETPRHEVLEPLINEAESFLAVTLALGMDLGSIDDMLAGGLAYHAYCDALARKYGVQW